MHILAHFHEKKLWTGEDRPNMVVMPVALNSHYYVVAVVLDPSNLKIAILESIGNFFLEIVTVVAKKLWRVIMHLAEVEGVVDPGPVLTPRVPHQPYRSNNCGLHSIEMATRIMNDSKEFLGSA